MKSLIYGYGSLINLKSASKALKRNLTKEQIITGTLKGYERNWTLWDNVFSNDLRKEVKAVFLNIEVNESGHLNGILFEVSRHELSNLLYREKNYKCVDVTKQVEFENGFDQFDQIFTFVGQNDYLISPGKEDYFIFDKYVEMVNEGVQSMSPEFFSSFKNTTKQSDLPRLSGTYTFVNSIQDSVR
jgi:cation transport regulator ChaC